MRRPAPHSSLPTIPAVTKKAPRKTTTASLMRWRGSSGGNAGTPTNRPGNSRSSIGVDVESQESGSRKGHQIAPPPPGGGLAERCDKVIVGLGPRRRTVAILQLTGNKDHRVAGDRELARAGLAPWIDFCFAIVAYLKRRNPLRSGLGQRIQHHLESEWKALIRIG